MQTEMTTGQSRPRPTRAATAWNDGVAICRPMLTILARQVGAPSVNDQRELSSPENGLGRKTDSTTDVAPRARAGMTNTVGRIPRRIHQGEKRGKRRVGLRCEVLPGLR